MSDYLAVNARISAPAMARLKQLSNRLSQPYGEVLSGLLLAVPLEQADWAQPLAQVQARMDELESRLNAMQAGTPPVGVVGAQAAQPIAESQSEECAAETGVESHLEASGEGRDMNGMEAESDAQEDVPSHPVQAPAPAKPDSLIILANLKGKERQKYLKIMRNLHKSGKSFREIGKIMFDEHRIATNSGKPIWPKSISDMLAEG